MISKLSWENLWFPSSKPWRHGAFTIKKQLQPSEKNVSSQQLTPAASPFAALMFGNKEWLKSGEVYKYSSMFVVIELVVMLLCSLPLANLLLH